MIVDMEPVMSYLRGQLQMHRLCNLIFQGG